MKWIRFVLGQSRGPRNMASRLPTIVERFGFTPGKSMSHLAVLVSLTDRYGVRPTLPVTAVVARRHPTVMRWLADRGVELGAHGLVHNDYAALSRDEQWRQVQGAHDVLAGLGLSVRGWRCPYSRWNEHTMAAVRAAGFAYDATPTYAWPAYAEENIPLPPRAAADYERLQRLFGVGDACRHSVLPTVVDGLVQIPMSIPQDEDMVDRLHLDAASMSRVWRRVLHDTRHHRDVFVMCLHPERASRCAEPLDDTLREARRLGDVWIATLGEIAEWWQERDGARVTVHAVNEGCWHATVDGSSRLVTRWGDHTLTGAGVLPVETPRKPVIHVGPEWPAVTLQRLHDAGYLADRGPVPAGSCALDLDENLPAGTPPSAVVRFVEERDSGLVRVQPWPAGYRSCLSITGDIDAVTLFDFAMRLKEF